MKKRKLKKSIIKKIIIIIILILAVIITKTTIKTMQYHKTDEYKLKKIGYNLEQIEKIEKETEENKNYILNTEYNEDIINIMNEKYYLSKNLEKYINYKKENPSKQIKEIITIINTGRDKELYTDIKNTDLEQKEKMLVNKYNKLEKDYTPEKIIKVPIAYAYSGVKASEEGLEYYKKMHNAAKQDGINLVISSAYRSYEEQQETYDEYEKIKKDKIDTYAARPGHSEHQTGLAFDILTLGVRTTEFDQTKEFEWLQQNAYKYGFILRYPKGKENITGFDYESWHYRYVGLEVAQKIHNENITFEEYYAYYIEK